MHILLLRPPSPNERFGLGPFFRVEPLGLEYVAAALIAQGHEVEIADLRFSQALPRLLRRFRPSVVGVACLHTVDVPTALATARRVKHWAPEAFTLVGGHAAAVYPEPVLREAVDAVALGDGEQVVPALVDALARGASPRDVAGMLVRTGDGDGWQAFTRTRDIQTRLDLESVPLPARHLIERFRTRYSCVHKTPLWAIETARGCPYRCNFCAVSKHQEHSFRMRAAGSVAADFERTGPHIFVVDDLFWHPPARSLELAKELARRGVRKNWILVQSRLDTVAKHRDILAAWRPLARYFDIFFGFEAPRDEQLQGLRKDMSASAIEQGVGVARELGFGVTGNFMIDPDWGEAEFEAMWTLVDRLNLERAGFTVLTPLPGTDLFEKMKPRIAEHDWARWDMHHLLVEPKLGRRRFYELLVESWRRNVLSSRHASRKWWGWLRELTPLQLLSVVRVLMRTQRMLRVDAYLDETFPMQVPAQF
ncbi:MAG: B12-binding domain-containing radical SAM protein [Polyangiaceae bacterium]|nr:B12-binding domain-containing radical SAM protein [Polyangiaceae bacterium]